MIGKIATNKSPYPPGRRAPEQFSEDPFCPQPELVSLLEGASIKVITAGEWTWGEGNRIPPRTLPVVNLVLYHDGQGPIEVGDHELRIDHPNTLVLIPRHQHQCASHDPGHPFRASSIHARLQAPHSPLDLLTIIGVPPLFVLNSQQDSPIIASFAEIVRLSSLRPPLWQTRADTHLNLIVHHFITRFGGQFLSTKNPYTDAESMRLLPLLDFIDRRLSKGPIHVDDLSEHSDLGAESLRRLFQQTMGMSTNRYIQSRRVERACQLLHGTDHTIQEIAEAVGLYDVTAFHRLFRRWMKTTPAKWRSGEHLLTETQS